MSALDQIAGYGITGALLVVALGAIWFLYREHAKERETMRAEIAEERAARAEEAAARIQDAKDNTALLLRVQQATTDAIGKFYELVKARQDSIRTRVDDR